VPKFKYKNFSGKKIYQTKPDWINKDLITRTILIFIPLWVVIPIGIKWTFKQTVSIELIEKQKNKKGCSRYTILITNVVFDCHLRFVI
jgi:hypothetical protein